MELVAQILAVVLTAFFTTAGGVFWWIVNRLARVERELADYKTFAEGHFVTEADLTRSISQLSIDITRLIDSFKDLSTEMRTSFANLQAQVNNKADK